MEEEKKNGWGGKRPNQTGRPKKDEELMVINLLDKHIDRDIVVIELFKKIKEGDMKAITLYLQTGRNTYPNTTFLKTKLSKTKTTLAC